MFFVEIVCPVLDQLDNGIITYSSGSPNNRTFNTTATYACSLGYKLIGQFVRTCQGDETWSGQEPTCHGNSFNISWCLHGLFIYGVVTLARETELNTGMWCVISTEIVCPDLDELSNGMIDYSSGTESSRPFNSIAMYSCGLGYKLIGQATRACQNNETWSGQEPSCIGNFYKENNFSLTCSPILQRLSALMWIN